MKTGRLLKFQRPGGEVHAYFYDDGGVVRASLYLMAPGYERSPVHEVTGSDAEEVESDVRDWLDCYFPKP
ncbi:MAG: hypothetical protein PVJ73_03930 [Acidobacteriota bacterium]|jgi:hypothetical protein|nr:hypothetical protein [Acidobacteriota bacterium]